jgi:tRNA pseudouridine55 synthase
MSNKAAIAVVNGILNLDKPSGVTSRDVVDCVARLRRGTKVGHAGTLDPLASGVLVVCVGSATRLIDWVQRMPKTYRAVVRLGARSDTLDADGQVVEVENPTVPTEEEVRRAIASQVGEILQLPPIYSALKIKGQRSYDLARAGRPVDLAPRLVRINRIDLVNFAWPRLELEIDCGTGTYVRSIARDLGETWGCGGLIETLVRTRIGPFTLETATNPASLTQLSLAQDLRPPLDAVPDLPRIVLDQSQVEQVLQGRAVNAASVSSLQSTHQEVALLSLDGRLIAIAHADALQQTVQPRKALL